MQKEREREQKSGRGTSSMRSRLEKQHINNNILLSIIQWGDLTSTLQHRKNVDKKNSMQNRSHDTFV